MTQKHFHNLILGVSVLPALLIMPAMADPTPATERLVIAGGQTEEQENISWSDFSGADYGGAIDNSGTLTATDVEFTNNSAIQLGGAIDNYGGNVTINGNSLFSENSSNTGGAIDTAGGHLTINSGAVFNHNTATNSGGAINMSGDTIVNIIGAYFENNSATQQGGVLHNNGATANITGVEGTDTFKSNSATNGGVLFSVAAGNTTFNDATFKSNSATNLGGAIYNKGILTVNNSLFDSNEAVSKAGAIYNFGTLSVIGSVFDGNNSGQAGAIIDNTTSSGGMTITSSTFKNNTATTGAGAIGIFSKNGTTLNNVQFLSNSAGEAGAVFVGAEAKANVIGGTFDSNTATTVGGAIATRDVNVGSNADAKLDIVGTTFKGNSAGTNGGAIYNNFYNSVGHADSVYISGATFGGTGEGEGNTAKNGGAIYNHANATQTGNMYITDSTFIGNSVLVPETYPSTTYKKEGVGGAIASTGIITINDSTFENNTALTTGNGYGLGGAVSTVTVDGLATDMTIIGSTFTNNSADAGGAVYGMLKASSQHGLSNITISNSTFEGNSAPTGSAIANFDVMSVTNSTFSGNKTLKIDDGGTVFVGSDSITSFTGGSFIDNISNTVGGAIATRSIEVGDNSYAKLDIVGTTFKGNSAGTNGGAIDNNFYNSVEHAGSVYVSGATFGGTVAGEGNSADKGGAIYNHANAPRIGDMYLNDTKFLGNTATTAGGAIYNEGVLTLAAANTFRGNKVGDTANDIHNLGTLNITSGTTTMDGGITGNGTLNIDEGATLNIGKATITQDTINLGGTLIAELVDGADHIFNVATEFKDNGGKLSLAIEKEGTYNLFSNAKFDKAQEQVTSTIFDLDWESVDGSFVATKKSVDDIAEQNHIEKESAAAVSAVADSASNSSSQQMKDLSVKLQEKLVKGDTDAVEHATKAILPETKSVAQSVSSSVQNTVVSLASARMALPAVGRNGGDAKLTSGGVWIQGLFNKSKQANAFDGNTRGFAAGLDGTINKRWTIGAGYSFARSNISGSARDTKIDSNTVFVYGQYKPSQWYLNAIANYTNSDYSEHGTVIENTPVFADYRVRSFGGNVATGYDFKTGITPELALRYMHVSSDDYTNSYGIKTHMDNTNYLTGVLGAKYAFNIVANKHTTFAPQLKAGFKYDLLSDANVATVTMPGVSAYSLDGNRLSRAGGEFGIGLGMRHHNLDISVNYDIDVRQDYTSQTGMLKLRANF